MMVNVPRKLKPFEDHGVDFITQIVDVNGKQLISNCCFCGGAKTFFANEKNTKWICNNCRAEGSLTSFLELVAKRAHEAVDENQWKRLSSVRGIPVTALKKAGFGFNGTHWLLAILSPEGGVRDIRRWSEKEPHLMSTSGCSLHLYNAENVARAKVVWICEGEWDAIILNWVFHVSKKTDHVAVGVPGAATFKDDWAELMYDKDVIVAYDADKSGDGGSLKAANKILNFTQDVRFLNWPVNAIDGWDIRDQVRLLWKQGKKSPEVLSYLEKLLFAKHRNERLKVEISTPEKKIIVPKFNEVLKAYQANIQMTKQMEDVVRIMFATVFAVEQPGDPIWMFIVGPSGAGKTMLISSLRGSSKVYYLSTLTPKALVSGWKSGPDPSLIPQFNGKCVVLKDFTEVLSSPQFAKDECYAVLRGAFDGNVLRHYGNGVVRKYEVHFPMVACVTHAIHKEHQATLGDRFLQFQLLKGTDFSAKEEVIRAARNALNESQATEMEKENKLMDLAGRFLSQKLPAGKMPKFPDEMVYRISALARLISALRAKTERDRFSDELLYRPSREVGTRLAKQLVKLGMNLAFIEGKSAVDASVYRLLERVALDTAIGFHVDLMQAIMQAGGEADRETLTLRTGIPGYTVLRRLIDLKDLQVLDKLPTNLQKTHIGRSRDRYRVSDWVRELWAEAGIKTNLRVQHRKILAIEKEE